MNRRIFMMIYITLATLTVIALQFLFLSDYLALFVFINPLLLIAVIALSHPKELQPAIEDETSEPRLQLISDQIDHTINTPLTKIIAQTERAIERGECSDDTLHKINQHAHELKQVSGMYTKYLSLIDLNFNQMSPMDFSDCLREAIIEHLSIIEANDIDYQLKIESTTMLIQAHEPLIKSALSLLIQFVFQHCKVQRDVVMSCDYDATHCQLIVSAELDDDANRQLQSQMQIHSPHSQHVVLKMSLIELICQKHHGTFIRKHTRSGWSFIVNLPSFSTMRLS